MMTMMIVLVVLVVADLVFVKAGASDLRLNQQEKIADYDVVVMMGWLLLMRDREYLEQHLLSFVFG